MTVPEMLLIGFAVGLTGAMAPGPMLFAAISSSMRNGWIAGPKMVFRHAILEALTCLLIIFGLAALVNDSMISTISLVGGLSLCVFGGILLHGRKNADFETREYKSVASPALEGLITSIFNPYFWIWWLSAGNSFIMEGLRIGILAVIVFMLGHWLADGVWFSMVSGSFSRGKKLMTVTLYRHTLTFCGLFLIVFGLLFIFHKFPAGYA